jgi:hypothetical protein
VTDERLAIVRKFGLACFVAGLAMLICVTTAWASSYSLRARGPCRARSRGEATGGRARVDRLRDQACRAPFRRHRRGPRAPGDLCAARDGSLRRPPADRVAQRLATWRCSDPSTASPSADRLCLGPGRRWGVPRFTSCDEVGRGTLDSRPWLPKSHCIRSPNGASRSSTRSSGEPRLSRRLMRRPLSRQSPILLYAGDSPQAPVSPRRA